MIKKLGNLHLKPNQSPYKFLILSKIQLWSILLCFFLLCESTQAINFSVAAENKSTEANPYTLSTREYLSLAKAQQGLDKQNSLLRAANGLISQGQWRQGAAILAQTHDLTPMQLEEKMVLLAKVDMLNDKPDEVLKELTAIEQETLSPSYRIQCHELLAQAFHSKGRLLESITQRIQLGSLLTDKKSTIKNQKILWYTLISLPTADLESFARQTPIDSDLHGWLKLALISGQHSDDPYALLSALTGWQQHYYAHPANQLLPNPLKNIANKMLAQPQQIALLLPLSGELSGPGKAIQEGVMAALKSKKSLASLKSYDTNQGDITAIYEQAIKEGADFVIGPLLKNQVSLIATMAHPVPTLLLNDFEGVSQNNGYLFGLSPTHEAIQVALKAHAKGHQRALIIAPKNPWGNQITQAFKTQWLKLTGTVTDTLLYSENEDLNKSIQTFLHITDSLRRERNIKQLLGASVHASTSRRQDFDVIFLLAYPSKARQIVPLINYYYAGDVPIYATSSVYSGSANALKDKDLDGLIFCDIPWVFSHQMGTKQWPEQLNSYNRLYALGMDSIALATQFNQLLLFPAEETNTESILYLKSTQQVARVLEWGQFKHGLAHSLG
ncbi:MAG: penicillin-binding protein activator [Legionella sp.]|nr:penicillin-binding protein activator [Legionella sp.]